MRLHKQAFVLMTAMPPTKGHESLVRFAANLAPTTVIINTQPHEPFVNERINSVCCFANLTGTTYSVNVNSYREPIQQNPRPELGEHDTKFWDMWVDLLKDYGLQQGDYIVGSELYCKTLADYAGCIYIPYDIERSIYPAKAETVRTHPSTRFDWIYPDFQKNLRLTVTFFGAESCGKTTLSQDYSRVSESVWLPEWARPYLESLGSPAVTDEHMRNIFYGQQALQRSRHSIAVDKPFIFQDTDLFSTLGYWRMYNPEANLIDLEIAASVLRSDLYILCPSDIPFEPDPLRYGGEVRESTDQYWIDILEEFNLNYVILDRDKPMDLLVDVVEQMFKEKAFSLTNFERER